MKSITEFSDRRAPDAREGRQHSRRRRPETLHDTIATSRRYRTTSTRSSTPPKDCSSPWTRRESRADRRQCRKAQRESQRDQRPDRRRRRAGRWSGKIDHRILRRRPRGRSAKVDEILNGVDADDVARRPSTTSSRRRRTPNRSSRTSPRSPPKFGERADDIDQIVSDAHRACRPPEPGLDARRRHSREGRFAARLRRREGSRRGGERDAEILQAGCRHAQLAARRPSPTGSPASPTRACATWKRWCATAAVRSTASRRR